jgi:decaprenylphospho-beta-D-erythro-pentofuranosid-2-ulose 2-reductase
VKDALGSVQSVLVFGGGSEIALAVSRLLVGDRARRVVLAVRDPGQVEPAAEELRAGGALVDVVKFDADDVNSHDQVMSDVFAGGDIDVVLVAFGVLGLGAESDRAQALDVVRTNVTGSVSVLLSTAQHLQAQGHGTIVVFSSVAGERVRKSNFVYGASKAAVDGFAQGLGDSLAGSGIHVMVVRPGFVHTKMTAGMDPAPFSTTPDKVAAAVVSGIRRGADTVWVPPLLRWVMVGVRHLPRRVFRRLPF